MWTNICTRQIGDWRQIRETLNPHPVWGTSEFVWGYLQKRGCFLGTISSSHFPGRSEANVENGVCTFSQNSPLALVSSVWGNSQASVAPLLTPNKDQAAPRQSVSKSILQGLLLKSAIYSLMHQPLGVGGIFPYSSDGSHSSRCMLPHTMERNVAT